MDWTIGLSQTENELACWKKVKCVINDHKNGDKYYINPSKLCAFNICILQFSIYQCVHWANFTTPLSIGYSLAQEYWHYYGTQWLQWMMKINWDAENTCPPLRNILSSLIIVGASIQVILLVCLLRYLLPIECSITLYDTWCDIVIYISFFHNLS